MPKTYFIKTLGCQANEADSNTMAGMLEALDFLPVKSLQEADLFILNTCSIRQKSEDKAYGMGKSLKRMKNRPFVVMSGCLVGSTVGERQRFAFEELQRRTPWVDLYINPSQIFDFPKLLAEKKILSDWATQQIDQIEFHAKVPEKEHALVNISYGCDNFCTFCVVPYARGKEVSRTKEEIFAEVKHLARRGIKHITLCGQNVNSWGLGTKEKFEIRTGSDDKIPFADLLRTIHELDGIEKIDFISSNPFDFTNDLIEAFALPKISNYLHIAVQSGNNEVLKRMNRRHKVEDFVNLIEEIKKVKPQVEVGTDIIVGFPGETHEQFMDTVELFKKMKFNVAYISIYSARKGTPAEKFFEDDVDLEEKKWRHAFLTEVWQESKAM